MPASRPQFGRADLDVEDRLVTMNSGPTVVPPDRVSMTYKLLNASLYGSVAVLTSSTPILSKTRMKILDGLRVRN